MEAADGAGWFTANLLLTGRILELVEPFRIYAIGLAATGFATAANRFGLATTGLATTGYLDYDEVGLGFADVGLGFAEDIGLD